MRLRVFIFLYFFVGRADVRLPVSWGDLVTLASFFVGDDGSTMFVGLFRKVVSFLQLLTCRES